MDFIAIDFETANSKRTSACSLGITTVKDNKIVDTKSYLIKPYPYYFDAINVSIHGITKMDVKDAPTFDILWKDISAMFENQIIVAHNSAFDISVLSRMLAHYDIPFPECDSLCTYKISRNAFPESGCYRLDFVSEILDVDLIDHHNSECEIGVTGMLEYILKMHPKTDDINLDIAIMDKAISLMDYSYFDYSIDTYLQLPRMLYENGLFELGNEKLSKILTSAKYTYEFDPIKLQNYRDYHFKKHTNPNSVPKSFSA